ncbi:MAG: hypothetical protein U1D55_06455 [Phycisphaerae bacterium]
MSVRTSARVRLAILAAACIAAAIPYVTGVGQIVQIRLDSGDLRWCYWGVPVWVERMPEPDRSAILAVSSSSRVIRPEWRTCAVYPRRTTNCTEAMCWGFYRRAVEWVPIDRNIARLALEDIANYIVATGAESSLPDCALLFHSHAIDPNTKRVSPNWQSDETVRWYCESKGYSPVNSAPQSAASQP